MAQPGRGGAVGLQTKDWKHHQSRLAGLSTRALLEQAGDELRFSQPLLEVDLGHRRLDPALRDALCQALDEAGLAGALQAMLRGEPVNVSEGRAELHCALRALPDGQERPELAAEPGWEELDAQREAMLEVAEALRGGAPWWRGRGAGIRHLVHLGMGGSDLGVRLAHRVFGDPEGLRLHFRSDLDPRGLRALLRGLNPAETLVVANSKSFGTRETLLLAAEALEWLRSGLDGEAERHLLGISAHPQKVAQQLGTEVACLQVPLDLCGRHSLWSAGGLAAAVVLGGDGYRQLLEGARRADEDFSVLDWPRNPAALTGAMDWYQGAVEGADARGLVVWDERLEPLVAYVQQLEMESLGKGVAASGEEPLPASGQVIWGGYGPRGQHSFLQMVHQGRRLLPLDMVVVETASRAVVTNAEAQMQALAFGHQGQQVEPWRRCPGDRPFGTLRLPDLQPAQLGYLLAFWEHRVFTQAVLYGLNPFDQWGVELAKDLVRKAEAGGG